MSERKRTTRRRTRASQAAFKPRRSHRKSRNGCAECRRRHIRCDKNHPVCFNCSTGDRDRACIYPAGAVPETAPGGAAVEDADSRAAECPSQSGSEEQIPSSQPPKTALPLAAEAGTFSATDLVVFHHAQTAMEHVGLGRKGQFRQVLALGMRHRARAPYLLDEILALACMHLEFHLDSFTCDAQAASLYAGMTAESLHNHTTALQTRAVASFNERMSERSDSDLDSARFLFAGMLSVQSLGETLHVLRSSSPSSLVFSDFLDRMLACFQLHGGVRAVTGTASVRAFLPRSRDVRGLMDFLHRTEDAGWGEQPRGRECAGLVALLAGDASEDLGAASLDACRGAAHSLQWSFDMCRGLAVHDGPHAASAFAVTAPAGYVEALRRRAPEALVVLAYYGVLLHRCREYWIFGDAGARLIRAIADHVGAYWREAMRWPLEQISEGDGGLVSTGK